MANKRASPTAVHELVISDLMAAAALVIAAQARIHRNGMITAHRDLDLVLIGRLGEIRRCLESFSADLREILEMTPSQIASTLGEDQAALDRALQLSAHLQETLAAFKIPGA